MQKMKEKLEQMRKDIEEYKPKAYKLIKESYKLAENGKDGKTEVEQGARILNVIENFQRDLGRAVSCLNFLEELFKE